MATFDRFEFEELLPPHTKREMPEWLHRKPVTEQFVMDVALWRERVETETFGVDMLMAYPDALAPLLDVHKLVKIWNQHKVTHPNFFKSLPPQRQKELMKILYDEGMKRTPAYRRGEDPTLDETMRAMPQIYREALEDLLPDGETIEVRVMKWLMA